MARTVQSFVRTYRPLPSVASYQRLRCWSPWWDARQTCNYENDGQCDVEIGTCPAGTDTADCTGDGGTGEVSPGPDSCRYANDG